MRFPEILCHTFINDFRQSPFIVDAGGNKGEFSRYVAEEFGARTYVLEPLPELFRNIPPHPGVVLFQEALTAKDGTVILDAAEGYASLHPGQPPAVPVNVSGISMATLMGRIPDAEVELFKMDIEGSEIELLEQVPEEILKRIRQMTVEFHDFVYPELTPRVEAIKERIKRMGFYAINFSLNNGDVLFVRKDRLGLWTYLWLKYPLKYWRGIKRRVRKLWKN